MATAIVTAGAGARGAYEAGVLSVVVPKLIEEGEKSIVLVGTSAGALNTAIMAGCAADGFRGVDTKLTDAWGNLDVDDVFTISALSILKSGIDFAFKSTFHDYALLDTQPLRRTVESGGAVDWKAFGSNFGRASLLKAAAVVATQAATGNSVVFVQGQQGNLPRENRPRGIEYVEAALSPCHVLASAAIPVLFPSVEVEERGWFMDGGVRLNTPISPGIDILTKVDPKGPADAPNRMIIVSTDPDPILQSTARTVSGSRPDIVDEGATILYSMFVDRVAEDVLALRRVNAVVEATAKTVVPDNRDSGRGPQVFQVIDAQYFGPRSRKEISNAAQEAFKAYATSSSHSLRGRARLDLISRALENQGPSHDEILSFILFDKDYLRDLIALGRKDAEDRLMTTRGFGWRGAPQ